MTATYTTKTVTDTANERAKEWFGALPLYGFNMDVHRRQRKQFNCLILVYTAGCAITSAYCKSLCSFIAGVNLLLQSLCSRYNFGKNVMYDYLKVMHNCDYMRMV